MSKDEMKKHIGVRIDENLKEMLEKARAKSGVPVSEIIRRGALNEAFQIISMFKGKLQRVDTCSQQNEKAK